MMPASTPVLLPCPRVLRLGKGFLRLPRRTMLRHETGDPESRSAAKRLQAGARAIGVELLPGNHNSQTAPSTVTITASCNGARPNPAGSYRLAIDRGGILVEYGDAGGLQGAVATLRQLFRQFRRRLPFLTIRDWPDFPRRGVMLDVSRGRVPRLKTLLGLVDDLADFKINEFQLYTEHTFAYGKYRAVWRQWGALTRREILRLDARCRELGIDLVPNQNSFGHLRQWLAHRPLRKLAEVSAPYESDVGDFVRFPSTLAPNHPGTLPFLRGLYDELLPNFSSRYFNVGCDETWDLGRGQSKGICERIGKGRVYADFLRKIQREVSARGRTMMFWADRILQHPEVIRGFHKDVVALNWGYEASHPFARETALLSKAGVRFYVCPGTSTWMTLIGRHDNALANLRSAARAGRRNGAAGYLITDWGDGGHPQPLAVSYLPYLAGAALSWCAKSFDEDLLVPVLNRDIFKDPSGRMASAALALGVAYREFKYLEPNSTPFGTTIAAPPCGVRELFCRNGLQNYLHIPKENIIAALTRVERQRTTLRRARPSTESAQWLRVELELAARMAGQSCRFMLWQHALKSGKRFAARRLAQNGIQELRKLDRDFSEYWPGRNKGTTKNCSAFLQWRSRDYRSGRLSGV